MRYPQEIYKIIAERRPKLSQIEIDACSELYIQLLVKSILLVKKLKALTKKSMTESLEENNMIIECECVKPYPNPDHGDTCLNCGNEIGEKADAKLFDMTNETFDKTLAAKKLGTLGGKATAKKYGKKHFSNAGKKGMAKRWNKIT